MMENYGVPQYAGYSNIHKYWDRQTCANNVDLDQTPQKMASDQGLHCLPLIQEYFRRMKSFKF